jgi:hypothetical protein
MDYMKSLQEVGKYRILYTASYELNHLLAFTEISFMDFDINVTGNPSDVRKKAYHNFVIKFDPRKQFSHTFRCLFRYHREISEGGIH